MAHPDIYGCSESNSRPRAMIARAEEHTKVASTPRKNLESSPLLFPPDGAQYGHQLNADSGARTDTWKAIWHCGWRGALLQQSCVETRPTAEYTRRGRGRHVQARPGNGRRTSAQGGGKRAEHKPATGRCSGMGGRIRNSAKNGLRGDQSGGRQEDELGDDEDGDEDSNADKRHGEYGLERRQQTRPNGKGVEHDCRR